MQVAGISEAVRAATQGRTVPTKPARTAFHSALEEAQAVAAAEHTVSRGETLSGICLDYFRAQGISPSRRDLYKAVAEVASANGLSNPDRIDPGQRLDLSALVPKTAPAAMSTAAPEPAIPATPVAQTTPPDPFLPVPTPSHAALAALQPHLSLLELNDTPPVAAGNPFLPKSSAALQASVAQAAGGPLPEADEASGVFQPSAAVEKVLKLVEKLLDRPDEKPAAEPLNIPSPWSRILGAPAHLTSEFGIRRDPLTRQWEQHDGIDLAARSGTEVRPFRPGEVVFSGWQSGYGQVVIVRHDDGLETLYGHNSKNLVQVGDRVTENTPLALVGSTGRSTGPHLHFEVRRHGRAVDPIPFMAAPSLDVAKAF